MTKLKRQVKQEFTRPSKLKAYIQHHIHHLIHPCDFIIMEKSDKTGYLDFLYKKKQEFTAELRKMGEGNGFMENGEDFNVCLYDLLDHFEKERKTFIRHYKDPQFDLNKIERFWWKVYRIFRPIKWISIGYNPKHT